MLEFCEAVGRVLAQDAFRNDLYRDYSIYGTARRTGSALIWESDAYRKVREITHRHVSGPWRSYSLFMDGEVLRVLIGYRHRLDAVKREIDRLGWDVPRDQLSNEMYAALGLLTIDQVARDNSFAAFNVPQAVRPALASLSTPEVDFLQKLAVDPGFKQASDDTCDDSWRCGCGVVCEVYPEHHHGDPAQWNCPNP